MEHFTIVYPKHAQVTQIGSDSRYRQQPLEKRHLLNEVVRDGADSSEKKEQARIGHGLYEAQTKDEVDRSRWLPTTNLCVLTLICFSASTANKNGVDWAGAVDFTGKVGKVGKRFWNHKQPVCYSPPPPPLRFSSPSYRIASPTPRKPVPSVTRLRGEAVGRPSVPINLRGPQRVNVHITVERKRGLTPCCVATWCTENVIVRHFATNIFVSSFVQDFRGVVLIHEWELKQSNSYAGSELTCFGVQPAVDSFRGKQVFLVITLTSSVFSKYDDCIQTLRISAYARYFFSQPESANDGSSGATFGTTAVNDCAGRGSKVVSSLRQRGRAGPKAANRTFASRRPAKGGFNGRTGRRRYVTDGGEKAKGEKIIVEQVAESCRRVPVSARPFAARLYDCVSERLCGTLVQGESLPNQPVEPRPVRRESWLSCVCMRRRSNLDAETPHHPVSTSYSILECSPSEACLKIPLLFRIKLAWMCSLCSANVQHDLMRTRQRSHNDIAHGTPASSSPTTTIQPGGRGGTVGRILTFHQGVPSSITGGAVPGNSHVGIVSDNANGRRVFSGISRFLPPLYSGAAPYSLRFTLIVSQGLDVKSRPNITAPQTLSRNGSANSSGLYRFLLATRIHVGVAELYYAYPYVIRVRTLIVVERALVSPVSPPSLSILDPGVDLTAVRGGTVATHWPRIREDASSIPDRRHNDFDLYLASRSHTARTYVPHITGYDNGTGVVWTEVQYAAYAYISSLFATPESVNQHGSERAKVNFKSARSVVNSLHGVDKIDVQHVYTEVTLAIGSQFIRHTLDYSEPIADLFPLSAAAANCEASASRVRFCFSPPEGEKAGGWLSSPDEDEGYLCMQPRVADSVDKRVKVGGRFSLVSSDLLFTSKA
ncbi:hypothetical protein PR048_022889 [Dryococelus australis]|uniref:Uncharacterized protein n=1 Tax=Dryococelus australis TaxID=614101 RepID=A0ABQ9GSJ1_9NEOP|nr:hypothetical protein PR048_022889 [Dryococelus australis]